MIKNDICLTFGIVNVALTMTGFHLISFFLDQSLVFRFRIILVAVLIPIVALLFYMFWLAATINNFFAVERILILNMTRKC
jgi:hypothetical protein